MNNVRFLSISMLGVFLGVCGCEKQPDVDEVRTAPRHVIAVIPKLTNTVYWQAVLAGAREASKDYGYEIIWDGPDRETNYARQIQIINDAISRPVEGVLVAPVDRTALVPSVDNLASLNIPCVIIDSGLDTIHFLSFASTDNYRGGTLAAQALGHALGGKGNVIVVRHIAGSHATIKRIAGFTDTISNDFPGIKIVDSESGQDKAEVARQVTKDMLHRHPDVQGLFACNVDVSVGALEALQDEKRNDVKMVAFDPDPSLISGLRSGEVSAIIVQDPYKMGYEGVKAIALHRNGQGVPRLIDTGVQAVTSDNITEPNIMRLLGEQQ